MNHTTRHVTWGALFVLFFAGVMAVVSRGQFDAVTISSIPVVLGSEVIVFAMMYLTIYHSENDEAHAHL